MSVFRLYCPLITNFTSIFCVLDVEPCRLHSEESKPDKIVSIPSAKFLKFYRINR